MSADIKKLKFMVQYYLDLYYLAFNYNIGF